MENRFQVEDREEQVDSERVQHEKIEIAFRTAPTPADRSNEFVNYGSQSDPNIREILSGVEIRPQTSRPKKRKEKLYSERDVKVQQMILDSIEKKHKQKTQQKIDVFNLDLNQNATESTDSGLPQRLIDQIITNVFDKASMRYSDRSKLECSICCTEFEDGDEIKILQCLHTHHKHCIDSWFAKKSVCPDCKFNIRALDVRQLF